MKAFGLKKGILAVCAIFSLLLSAAAACACHPEHHENADALTPHPHALATSAHTHDAPTTAAHGINVDEGGTAVDPSNALSDDDSCVCIAESHSAVVVAKRVNNDARSVDLGLPPRFEVEFYAPAIVLETSRPAPDPAFKYLSLLRISLPSRAPPRL